MNDIINIRVAGLGGMGVLKATLILGELFFELGWDVKKAEVHGMSQRGGSVSSDVRLGRKKILSPMIPEGKVDFLLSFMPEWSDTHRVSLAPDGKLVSSDDFDASKLATQKSLNIAMLGALSRHFDEIPESKWIETVKKYIPEKLWQINIDAFKLGRNGK